MLVNWYMSTLLMIAMTAGLAQAAEGTPQERIEAAQKEIQRQLTQMQNDLAELRGKIERLETAQARAAELADLRNKLDSLARDMKELRDEMRTVDRRSTSGYDPMPRGPAGSVSPPEERIPPTRVETYRASGALFRLINEFPTTQQVMVNGQSLLIEPGASIELPIAAGQFSFQVIGRDLVPRIRTVAPGAIYTARLHL